MQPLPPSPDWTDFFRGLWLPLGSARLLFASRTLFLLSLAAALVTLIALVGLVAVLGTSTDDLVGAIWAKPPSWYGSAAWYLVVALTFMVLLVVGLNSVPLLLLAPLQDPISEATEALLGGFTAPPFSWGDLARSSAVSLFHTVQRVALLLGGHLLLLPLHLVPGVGSLIWTGLGATWTCWWLAGEYLSGPMARHLYPFGEVRRALSARRALSMGFGSAVYLLTWIPVLNLFFMPLAIVSGTVLFRALRDAGHLPLVGGPRPSGAIA